MGQNMLININYSEGSDFGIKDLGLVANIDKFFEELQFNKFNSDIEHSSHGELYYMGDCNFTYINKTIKKGINDLIDNFLNNCDDDDFKSLDFSLCLVVLTEGSIIEKINYNYSNGDLTFENIRNVEKIIK
ncbi:MAG: hypothetical protein HRU03_01495 [Nanoarchaeales archaeon]|nr:hypothetical protein [Nanoarchaeales archaeon]